MLKKKITDNSRIFVKRSWFSLNYMFILDLYYICKQSLFIFTEKIIDVKIIKLFSSKSNSLMFTIWNQQWVILTKTSELRGTFCFIPYLFLRSFPARDVYAGRGARGSRRTTKWACFGKREPSKLPAIRRPYGKFPGERPRTIFGPVYHRYCEICTIRDCIN